MIIMKNSFAIIIVFMLTPALLFGQSAIEEIEYFQAIFGMEKKAIVAQFIKLDDQSKSAFWTAYDQYEAERKALGQQRIALLADYAENYNKLTDEKIEALITATIKQKSTHDKLVIKYYKRMKKAAGTKVAAQFFQVENYFQSVIRASILEHIPFIGELGG